MGITWMVNLSIHLERLTNEIVLYVTCTVKRVGSDCVEQDMALRSFSTSSLPCRDARCFASLSQKRLSIHSHSSPSICARFQPSFRRLFFINVPVTFKFKQNRQRTVIPYPGTNIEIATRTSSPSHANKSKDYRQYHTTGG